MGSQKFSKVKAVTELVSEIARTEKELKEFASHTLTEIQEVRWRSLPESARDIYPICCYFVCLQRRVYSEKAAENVKQLDANTSSIENSIGEVSSEVNVILTEFEELLPVVHGLFAKIGCEKMFSHADDATEGQTTGPSDTDVSKPQLPAMFASPGVIQTIRSGITAYNLPLVRMSLFKCESTIVLLLLTSFVCSSLASLSNVPRRSCSNTVRCFQTVNRRVHQTFQGRHHLTVQVPKTRLQHHC